MIFPFRALGRPYRIEAISAAESIKKTSHIPPQDGMIIPSFEDAESSSSAMFEREFFGPSSDGAIVFGFEQTPPVLFMAVKSRGDGDDVAGFLRLKTSFDLPQKPFPAIPLWMEIIDGR